MGTYAKIKRLPVREKMALLAGSLFLLAIVAHWGVVAPAKKQIEKLNRSAAILQSDLFQMRLTLIEAERLRKPESYFKSKNNGEISQYISASIKKSGVESVGAVSETGPSGLAVEFKSVEYARMMEWLAQIRVESGLTVEYAKIEPANGPDMVSAEMVLMK